MAEWFSSLHPVLQALIAGIFTWLVTALGAGIVLVTHRVDRRVLDAMLGFSGGVMVSLMAGFVVMMVLDVMWG